MSEVLALKYRPKQFSEVIGQGHVIKQLEAALEKGTLGHALLFCGTRGTGKTTTARIAAKELNRSFPEIYNNWENRQSLVLIEIDAASNTGVDNVREITENVRYAAQGHRVVVIDECHMLSKPAFNALLKTLEEPPTETTFILCTTEPYKLLDTVKSRCQIYEFREVDQDTLKAYYNKIMELEGVTADVSAAAVKANGSVRDGLSLLQKSLAGEQETDNSKVYYELVGAIYNRDAVTALELTAVLRKTEEAKTIIQMVEKWLHWCALENFSIKTPVREFFGSGKLEFDLARLQSLFDSCLNIERNLFSTPNSKIVLEMGIMKLTL